MTNCDEDSEMMESQLHQINGHGQSTVEKLRSIPTFTTQLLLDIQKLASQYDKTDDIPNLIRLEIRQKISLSIQCELMSIFQPTLIGPNLSLMLEKIKKIEYKQFLCACSSTFKDEPSFRGHQNIYHKLIMEFTTQFQDFYHKLPDLDFDLLGDTSLRDTYKHLLGDIKEQQIRLCKLFAFRKLITHSIRVRSVLEQERIKKMLKIKTAREKIRGNLRRKVAEALNGENFIASLVTKREN